MADMDSTATRKSATVYEFEFARAFVALKKTPASRRKKCLELLHEQAQLEARLRTVRSMLDAVMNTPLPGHAKAAQKLATSPGAKTGFVPQLNEV